MIHRTCLQVRPFVDAGTRRALRHRPRAGGALGAVHDNRPITSSLPSLPRSYATVRKFKILFLKAVRLALFSLNGPGMRRPCGSTVAATSGLEPAARRRRQATWSDFGEVSPAGLSLRRPVFGRDFVFGVRRAAASDWNIIFNSTVGGPLADPSALEDPFRWPRGADWKKYHRRLTSFHSP